jgi:hypothetical protein
MRGDGMKSSLLADEQTKKAKAEGRATALAEVDDIVEEARRRIMLGLPVTLEGVLTTLDELTVELIR